MRGLIDLPHLHPNNGRMRFWSQVRAFRPHKLRRVGHHLRRLAGAADRRHRVAQSASDDRLYAFWSEHGREWGEQHASEADLKRIASLAARIARLGEARAAAEVVGELKSIWSLGFADPADAFGWDDMNDQLPVSAMVAFVKGAGEAWEARQMSA
jgi:hypothetical protein